MYFTYFFRRAFFVVCFTVTTMVVWTSLAQAGCNPAYNASGINNSGVMTGTGSTTPGQNGPPTDSGQTVEPSVGVTSPSEQAAGSGAQPTPETKDSDFDGVPDPQDGCPFDSKKIAAGECGCGVADVDTDGDKTYDCNDQCPNDVNKTEPGACGCGVADIDSDGDKTYDCNDQCPNDVNKTEPGACGCGVADVDTDGDKTYDCNDQCPNDPDKIEPGECGCGVPDSDSDEDGIPDCKDDCPEYDPTNPACDPAAGGGSKPPADPNIGDGFQGQTPWGQKPQEGTGVVGGGDQPLPQPPEYTGEKPEEEEEPGKGEHPQPAKPLKTPQTGHGGTPRAHPPKAPTKPAKPDPPG